MGREKNNGIEILRIVLMFLIISGHLFAHTGIRETAELFSFKWFFIWGAQSISVCAVDCFVMITGYFSWNKEFSLKKLEKLWGTVILYSLGIFAVLCLLGLSSFTGKNIADSLFPVLRNKYWFFRCYILLYLFSPFINAGIRNLSLEQHRKASIVIVIIFYVFPLFSFFFPPIDTQDGYSVICFITLYIVAAYLGRAEVSLKRRICLIALVINNLIVVSSKIVLIFVVRKFSLDAGTGLLYHNNSVFQLINAALLLLFFKDITVKIKERAIAFVTKSVFPVYLIHENFQVRPLIWNDTLTQTLLDCGNTAFVLLVIAESAGIFLVCLIIDSVLRFLIKRIKYFVCGIAKTEKK